MLYCRVREGSCLVQVQLAHESVSDCMDAAPLSESLPTESSLLDPTPVVRSHQRQLMQDGGSNMFEQVWLRVWSVLACICLWCNVNGSSEQWIII